MDELLFQVSLRRGDEQRSWEIRQNDGGFFAFRTVGPGNSYAGGLSTLEAVKAKRKQFEAEIEQARKDGWQ